MATKANTNPKKKKPIINKKKVKGDKPDVTSISELKPDKDNPREIEFDAMRGLGHSIDSFGDLSGIVYNTKLKKLVSGHRRVESLIALYGGQLNIVDGFITTPNGDKFRVRFVDFDMDTHSMARDTANNPHIAGFFTDKLQAHLEVMRDKNPDQYDDLRMAKLERIPKKDKTVPGDDDKTTSNLSNDPHGIYKVMIDVENEEQQNEIIEQLKNIGIEGIALLI